MSDESRRGDVDRDADLGVPALVDDDSMIGGSLDAALLRGGEDMLLGEVVGSCGCVWSCVVVFSWMSDGGYDVITTVGMEW
jgi:hypothetical protein